MFLSTTWTEIIQDMRQDIFVDIVLKHSQHKTCIELCFLHSSNNEITEMELTDKSSNLSVMTELLTTMPYITLTCMSPHKRRTDINGCELHFPPLTPQAVKVLTGDE